MHMGKRVHCDLWHLINTLSVAFVASPKPLSILGVGLSKAQTIKAQKSVMLG